MSVIPTVIFTDPQVASVGLTEHEARLVRLDVKTSVLDLKHVPRAITSRNTNGLVKVIADASADRLLGVHIIAREAGEVIQTAATILAANGRCEFTLQDIRTLLFPHQVEALKLAVLSLTKDVEMLSCCAG
ncbi:MAG: mercury(II) reductase, partial [Candidatus Thorarchaeota archaeon]